MISNDGKYIVCRQSAGRRWRTADRALPTNTKRSYQEVTVVITEDSRYVVFKIKPVFQKTRQARIKRRSPMKCQRFIGIVELGKEELIK
jgi:hypothetical protein